MSNAKSMFDGNRINIIKQESPLRLLKAIDMFKRNTKSEDGEKKSFEDRVTSYINDNIALNIIVKNKSSTVSADRKDVEKLIKECIEAINMIYNNRQSGGAAGQPDLLDVDDVSSLGNSAVSVVADKFIDEINLQISHIDCLLVVTL